MAVRTLSELRTLLAGLFVPGRILRFGPHKSFLTDLLDSLKSIALSAGPIPVTWTVRYGWKDAGGNTIGSEQMQTVRFSDHVHIWFPQPEPANADHAFIHLPDGFTLDKIISYYESTGGQLFIGGYSTSDWSLHANGEYFHNRSHASNITLYPVFPSS
ncbi:MAG: hypothetical protein OXI59_13795 [Gemmatimonadota bacterium]|nr:hypothetical protein [Gemmatimonadota bacterium]